ncbi:hypothetical protein T492DRAFT_916742, partial [Pavlovales sp. CCMP2436]
VGQLAVPAGRVLRPGGRGAGAAQVLRRLHTRAEVPHHQTGRRGDPSCAGLSAASPIACY